MSDIGNYSTTNPKSKSARLDPVDLATQFREEVLQNKPSLDFMKAEIQMNALKIRPYAGDVFHLNMSNAHFIDALWSILKWEEYVQKSGKGLPNKDAHIFYKLMKQYRDTFQDQINRVDMRLPHIKNQGIENPVTVEIFRDNSSFKQKRKLH